MSRKALMMSESWQTCRRVYFSTSLLYAVKLWLARVGSQVRELLVKIGQSVVERCGYWYFARLIPEILLGAHQPVGSALGQDIVATAALEVHVAL